MEKIYMTLELEKEIYGDSSIFSREGMAKFKAWMAKHPHIYYYAEDNENFSELVGEKKAKEAGCSTVLLDNLS